MVLINPGTQYDKASIQLATKEGNWIRNERRQQRLPIQMQAAEKTWKQNCPGIETRSLSSSYNCVGMVFASRRTAIDTSELELIFKDDKYQQIADKANLKIGDLVVYRSDAQSDITHIGCIVSITSDFTTASFKIKVLSQWGFDGEYIHDENNVPQSYGRYLEYYSEKVS